MKRGRAGTIGAVGLAASLMNGSLAAEPCQQQLVFCMVDASGLGTWWEQSLARFDCRLEYNDCLFGYFIF
jgi:hypothetical protein